MLNFLTISSVRPLAAWLIIKKKTCLGKILFLLPTGAAQKGFIEEMTRLIGFWTYNSNLETIA